VDQTAYGSACGQWADDELPSVSVLREFVRDGRAWVAVDGADVPVAYLPVDVVAACAHLEQASARGPRASADRPAAGGRAPTESRPLMRREV